MTAATDNSLSLRQALEYCLDVLKIKQHSGFMGRTTADVPLAMVKTLSNWIIAMKLIADWNGALGNSGDNYVFSQTQLYDFLALAAKVIEETKKKASDNKVVLEILRDIMENYENFSHRLKSDYPRIIVDVISILHRGIDTNGIRINPIIIEKYYQSRKQQAAMTKEEGLKKSPSTTTTAAAAIQKEKIPLSKDELVERLVHITNRDKKELQKSMQRLPYSDLKKISELCRNNSKLQHYSKLITTKEQLKNEIQREIGRELRSHEIVRAANSVRRARSYIENILDNKFMPDASHGINHIKHNLEYGYRLMNLIELPRRRPRAQ
jgi:hypothetical protein